METVTHSERAAPRAQADFAAQFIAGRWRHGRSPGTNVDRNPYNAEVLAEIPQASREDLEEAYAAAARAQPDWARRLPGQRAAIKRRTAQLMEQRREEIIGWIVRESGGTSLKATLEWEAVHGVLGEASALPYLVESRILPADVPHKESRVYRRPVGVVGIISPWNWPMQLTARSLFPALALGNAAVVKPASDTPVCGGLLFAQLLEEAGRPAGVVSVLVGAGREIGDAFVSHPIPRVISFTGSTPVGRRIGRLAAEAEIVKRVELELGGNSPLVVLDDADLDYAIAAAVFGKFLHQGQICMIANRIIVDDAIFDRFVAGFVARVRALKVGDPDQPDTMIGPIINQSQLDGLLTKIAVARRDGLKQLAGGEPQGLVLPPHVFVDVPNRHVLAHEEIFGPIAPIVRARGEAEALRLANDTSFGLSSAVITRDLERGLAFAQQVQAGMTHVNDQPVNDIPFNPFGGEKNSGIGRFNGRWGIRAFTTEHWITIQRRPRVYPQHADQIGGAWAGG